MQAKRSVWIFIGVIYVFFAGAADAGSLNGVWTKTTDPGRLPASTLLIVEDINVKAIGYGMISGKPAIGSRKAGLQEIT